MLNTKSIHDPAAKKYGLEMLYLSQVISSVFLFSNCTPGSRRTIWKGEFLLKQEIKDKFIELQYKKSQFSNTSIVVKKMVAFFRRSSVILQTEVLH